ncbi:MAG: hypothetical protein IJR26_02845 [Bacteroidales bacterium]|nr:hypothetical protein [Bacteroidales bacterium]
MNENQKSVPIVDIPCASNKECTEQNVIKSAKTLTNDLRRPANSDKRHESIC